MSNLYDELSQFIQENAAEWALTEDNPQLDLAHLVPSHQAGVAGTGSGSDNMPPQAAPHLYLPYNFYSSFTENDSQMHPGAASGANGAGPRFGSIDDSARSGLPFYQNCNVPHYSDPAFHLAASKMGVQDRSGQMGGGAGAGGQSGQQQAAQSHPHSHLQASYDGSHMGSSPYGIHPSQAMQTMSNHTNGFSGSSQALHHMSLSLPLDMHHAHAHAQLSTNNNNNNNQNANNTNHKHNNQNENAAPNQHLHLDSNGNAKDMSLHSASGPSHASVAVKSSPSAKRFRHFTEDQVTDHLNATKYLMFLPATRQAKLYDAQGAETQINISVSLAGNFFLSEPHPSDFDEKEPEIDLSQYDLTFYRRNLFHVTAIVSNAHNAVTAQRSNFTSRILSLSLAVSVTGNDKKPPRPLVYCPPRSLVPDPKASPQQGPSVKMIYPKRSGYDEVVNWKRLQFRTATAYNGRKKMRNYVSVVVQVYAELENAQRICLLTAQSHPIVVRGRNPRFYENRENITIPGGVIDRPFSEMKQEDSAVAVDRDSVESDTTRSQAVDSKVKSEHDFDNDNENDLDLDLELENDNDNENDNDLDNENDNDDTKDRTNDLAFDDDDEELATPTSPVPSMAFGKREYDYEYFPMPLNYWLAPVEVVYRPHAAHHPMKLTPNQGKLPGQPKRALSQ